MVVNRAAENVLGTIGTICWTIQVLPQIYKSYRSKSTDGLSEWLMLLWALSGSFLGVYVIVQNLNIPLILQPQLFSALVTLSWAQCQYYGHKRPRSTCLIAFFVVLVLLAGFEAGMVYAVRPAFYKGNLRPVRAFGILSSVTISLGLLPQFYEIYRYKEVIGISMTFMFVDCLGGVFSILSLVFKKKFDVVASLSYSLVVLLDGLVIVAYFILNPIAKRRRRRERQGQLSAQNTIVSGTPERKPSQDEVRQSRPALEGEGIAENGEANEVPGVPSG